MQRKQSLGRRVVLVAAQMCLVAAVCSAAAERFIVKDGEARARIVIAPERARMVSLAALELQHYIEKISGARLPIGAEPGEGVVNIYVGRGAATDRLRISDEGLQYGTFRMVSGPTVVRGRRSRRREAGITIGRSLRSWWWSNA